MLLLAASGSSPILLFSSGESIECLRSTAQALKASPESVVKSSALMCVGGCFVDLTQRRGFLMAEPILLCLVCVFMASMVFFLRHSRSATALNKVEHQHEPALYTR